MRYFILFTFCIFVCYLLGFVKKPKKYRWMDRNYTTAIKGFSILTVVWAHSGGCLSVEGIQFVAGIGVALFLMCSGYGLEVSYEKNGLNGFWQKRLLGVCLPFWIVELVGLLVTSVFSIPYVIAVTVSIGYYWLIYIIPGLTERISMEKPNLSFIRIFNEYLNPKFDYPLWFIDAKKDLSVQVHPTDAYAQEHENGQLGKTEMWYVLDAGREAKLVYGLKQNCTKAEMRRAIADGTVMKYLQKVPIHKDDLFFIQAGTVHAIGAGALVAEIQENSNLTYRLYDYDRVGKDGKKRELHIDKALDVANLKSSAEPKQPLRVLKYRQGVASELLTRCKYFEVYRMIVNTERRQKVHYRADEIAFRVLLCVNGCGTISYEGGNLPFYKGDCIFVPADSEVLTIHGQAQFLDVRG